MSETKLVRFAYVPIGHSFYSGPQGTVIFTKVDEDHAVAPAYENHKSQFLLAHECRVIAEAK